jgi:hypothetical protein
VSRAVMISSTISGQNEFGAVGDAWHNWHWHTVQTTNATPVNTPGWRSRCCRDGGQARGHDAGAAEAGGRTP